MVAFILGTMRTLEFLRMSSGWVWFKFSPGAVPRYSSLRDHASGVMGRSGERSEEEISEDEGGVEGRGIGESTGKVPRMLRISGFLFEFLFRVFVSGYFGVWVFGYCFIPSLPSSCYLLLAFRLASG